jgi:hypothetical protein
MLRIDIKTLGRPFLLTVLITGMILMGGCRRRSRRTPTATASETPISANAKGTPVEEELPTSVASESLSSPFGVAFGEGSANLSGFMGYIRDLGVRRTKVSFFWSELEPAPGQYDFSKVDEYLTQLLPGDRALLNVFTNSPWCTNSRDLSSMKGAPFIDYPYDDSSYGKSCREYYRDFIRALAGEVKLKANGGIKYWQRDTEPATSRHWPADKAKEYVETQKIFYETVKSVLPDALVIDVSANGVFEYVNGVYQPKEVEFFDYVIRYGKDYFDMLDLRLYGDRYDIPERVDWFRERMRMYGYEKPIVCTEYGGPDPRELNGGLFFKVSSVVRQACEGAVNPEQCFVGWVKDNFERIDPKLQVFLFPASSEQDAKRDRMHCHDIIQRDVIILSSGVKELWRWNLQSSGVHPIFGKMRLMDFETDPRTKLPPYFCYQRMVEKLEGLSSVRRIPHSDKSIYFYEISMSNTNSPMYVVWHRDEGVDPYDAESAPPVRVSLQVGFNKVKITDAFGNEEIRFTSEGVLSLGVTDTLLYIERMD